MAIISFIMGSILVSTAYAQTMQKPPEIQRSSWYRTLFMPALTKKLEEAKKRFYGYIPTKKVAQLPIQHSVIKSQEQLILKRREELRKKRTEERERQKRQRQDIVAAALFGSQEQVEQIRAMRKKQDAENKAKEKQIKLQREEDWLRKQEEIKRQNVLAQMEREKLEAKINPKLKEFEEFQEMLRSRKKSRQ